METARRSSELCELAPMEIMADVEQSKNLFTFAFSSSTNIINVERIVN